MDFFLVLMIVALAFNKVSALPAPTEPVSVTTVERRHAKTVSINDRIRRLQAKPTRFPKTATDAFERRQKRHVANTVTLMPKKRDQLPLVPTAQACNLVSRPREADDMLVTYRGVRLTHGHFLDDAKIVMEYMTCSDFRAGATVAETFETTLQQAAGRSVYTWPLEAEHCIVDVSVENALRTHRPLQRGAICHCTC